MVLLIPSYECFLVYKVNLLEVVYRINIGWSVEHSVRFKAFKLLLVEKRSSSKIVGSFFGRFFIYKNIFMGRAYINNIMVLGIVMFKK